jgi:hypothetical protein
VFSGYDGTGGIGFSYRPVGRHGRSRIGIIGGDRLTTQPILPMAPMVLLPEKVEMYFSSETIFGYHHTHAFTM